MGKVADLLLSEKRQQSLYSESLTVEKVYSTFYKIALSGGQGSQEVKIKALAELLNSATPKEARYIVRFPIGRLRLGIGDPTILDALSAYKKGDKSLRNDLERAYNLCSDLGLVAKTLFENEDEILKFRIKVFSPVRPALAERLTTAQEIIEKIGKCFIDSKYDGLRIQCHMKDGKIELFSRKLEPMTHMFPDVVEAIKKQIKAKEIIFEGEAVAYNEQTNEYLSFQLTMQRKRKYDVKEKAQEFPLRLFAFDLIYADNVDYTQMPFIKRREKLEKIIAKGDTISLSNGIVTEDPNELEKFFQNSFEKGLEGIIAKDLNAEYVAGARKFAWIKLKRSYRGELADTIDAVIAGYYLGKGRRAKFEFGGLLCAVYDEEEDMFRTIAKIGSGFSEDQMRELKEMLDRIKLDSKPARLDTVLKPDFFVELKYTVTIAADEITRSPMHTCGKKGETGYALRFPRMVGNVRFDKKAEDSTTVSEIIHLFEQQKRVSME